MAGTDYRENRPGTKNNPITGIKILVPDTWALDVREHFPGNVIRVPQFPIFDTSV